jgi:hypothetical protein
VYYWNIDTDTDDADVLFYAAYSSTVSSPELVTSWSAYGSGAGTPAVLSSTSTAPEINVRGNFIDIASGTTTYSYYNFTNFGSIAVSGTITKRFVIQNKGAGSLTISSVAISGSNASDFSVTTAASSTVASLDSTAFVITFTPSASGTRSATVTINNNDSDEGAYTFLIDGYGVVTSNLTVSGITSPSAANGTYIYKGILNGYRYWKHQTATYYIYNDDYSSSRYWYIDNDSLDAVVIYFSANNGSSFSPTDVTSWDTLGTSSKATGTPVVAPYSAPEINLKGNNQSIASGTTSAVLTNFTNFGSVVASSGTNIRRFVIQNTGSAALTLSGSSPYVTLSGTNASSFAVTTAPSASIAANDTTYFVVTFTPTAEGMKTATVTINNNDSDEGTYTFAIKGYGATAKNIVVSGITNPSAANGTYAWRGIYNEFQYWKHQTASYYIYNHAYKGNTHYWNIDNDTLDTNNMYFFSHSCGDSALPTVETTWDTTGTYFGATGTVSMSYTATPVEPAGENTPKSFSLGQNYPNPFNPSTTISYQLAMNSDVTLKVYDVLGREVAMLVNGMQSAGSKTVEWNASKFTSGVYFYKLTAGSFQSVKKLLLMK